MFPSRSRLVACVVMTTALFSLLGPTTRAQEKKAAPKVEKKTYDFKDAKKEKMEYALFVPSGYDKEKKSPLIIALHGLGGNPQQVHARPRADRAGRKRCGYIVAAPMGYNERGWYGVRGTKGGKGEDPENLGELSEKDVINVLGIVKKDYNVDPNRVYLMGHSMGGGGTVAHRDQIRRRMGCAGSDRTGDLRQEPQRVGEDQEYTGDTRAGRQGHARASRRCPPLGGSDEETRDDLRLYRGRGRRSR